VFTSSIALSNKEAANYWQFIPKPFSASNENPSPAESFIEKFTSCVPGRRAKKAEPPVESRSERYVGNEPDPFIERVTSLPPAPTMSITLLDCALPRTFDPTPVDGENVHVESLKVSDPLAYGMCGDETVPAKPPSTVVVCSIIALLTICCAAAIAQLAAPALIAGLAFGF
jgi:hypothetical protein